MSERLSDSERAVRAETPTKPEMPAVKADKRLRESMRVLLADIERTEEEKEDGVSQTSVSGTLPAVLQTERPESL